MALGAMVMLVASPAALAQTGETDDLDCADFASQEAAQAELDADPSDPNGLDADDDGIACESLGDGEMEDGTMMGENTGAAAEDLDCADFATQEEAQAVYNQDPSDPNGLDADNDGIACEEGNEDVGNGAVQYGTDEDGGEVVSGTVPETDLPDTGGPGGSMLLLPAAGLLLATGLIGMRMVRR